MKLDRLVNVLGGYGARLAVCANDFVPDSRFATRFLADQNIAVERTIYLPGGSGFTTHPPMLQPGKSTTFRLLLRGYRLKPGKYELRVSGTVDVAWREPDPFSHVVGRQCQRRARLQSGRLPRSLHLAAHLVSG